MLFWLFFTIVILFLLFVSDKCKNIILKRTTLILSAFLMILLLGCRSSTMGLGDVKNIYIPIFEKHIVDKSFFYIFQYLKDPIFYILVKVISIISSKFQLVLVVYAIFVVVTILGFLKKESKSLLISVIAFFALNFWGTAFSGLRHIVSLMVTIYAYKYFKENNLKKFLIYIFIASCFHISAICFGIVYIFKWLKLKEKRSFFVFLNIILIFVFFLMKLGINDILLNIFSFFVEFFNFTRFEMYAKLGYSSLNNVLFMINYLIFIIANIIYFSVKITDFEKKNRFEELIWLQFLGTFFSCLTSFLGEFNRIAMFYTIYSIILIPECISYIKKGGAKILIEFMVGMMLLCYFLFFGIYNYNLVPFEFFWN